MLFRSTVPDFPLAPSHGTTKRAQEQDTSSHARTVQKYARLAAPSCTGPPKRKYVNSRKQAQADKREGNISTTCMPSEYFPPGEESGMQPLRIASINIGTGGLANHMRRIIEWARKERLAIIHVQEARVWKWSAPSIRKMFKGLTSDYRLFLHCSDGSRPNPTTAVATIMRKEVAQHAAILSMTPTPTSPLTGRILAFRIKMPDAHTPLVDRKSTRLNSSHSSVSRMPSSA